ncbi:Secreted RxLR effector peptide protein [Phytophthora palmivora]|uniref:Secreted RxLR effector peptide protein n=1 Tax=Phytophthora palmivora TaxID=4796 RepID=A0A2P4X082_9STRA|nr:Secreted RxLR effector peptide protein [Phytophthora palmivora]
MQGYHFLLVLVATFLITSGGQETTATDQARTFTNSIVAATSTKRFLRADKLAAESYAFDDIDSGDNGGDVMKDTKADSSNVNNPQERAGEVAALQKLNSLKTLRKTFSRTMSRASNSFSDKVSPLLSMKGKVQVWSNNGKSIDFVKKQLKLDLLTGDELTQALKHYDNFVTLQLPVWTRNKLTPDEVLAQLGLQGLSGTALISNRDFKHYDNFMKTQILVWGKEDLPVDDAVVLLGLNTLTGNARKDAANYKYYEEFLGNQLVKWLENGDEVDDVLARLKLNFIKAKLRVWAMKDVDPTTVQNKLGMGGLQGEALERHPNYKFLDRYIRKRFTYQEDGMLKQGLTTFDIWKMLEVHRIKNTVRKSSTTFAAYKRYVNKMDDYIIWLKKNNYEIPDLRSKDATPEELWEKTLIWTSAKRPDWYVKYSLGLDGLGENLLKEAPTLGLYNYYREGMKLPPIASTR